MGDTEMITPSPKAIELKDKVMAWLQTQELAGFDEDDLTQFLQTVLSEDTWKKAYDNLLIDYELLKKELTKLKVKQAVRENREKGV